ncbi:MAG TPA: hypothetical protein VFV68_17895 [Agriterribacter sp.]|nr:hypothetical protein [Agriterribacter sp.]
MIYVRFAKYLHAAAPDTGLIYLQQKAYWPAGCYGTGVEGWT